MKRVALIALLVGLGAAWYFALPPRAWSLPPAPAGLSEPVRGAIHVHSRRSDGTATVDEIAAAAARAGLDFVVVTDHGDATREPERPQYREGVLCIDAVEISTEGGHVIALGLPPAPYPLAGEPRDVLEDIARFGGFGIAAHPGSAKSELRWNEWTAPIGGLEWLNGDSEWRDESIWSLARALLTYPIRRTETLVSLLDRPDATLQRWDELTRQRRVVAIAGADAHARIGLRSLGEPYDNSAAVHIPAYEQMLRVFSNALPATTLSGDAAADAQAVVAALRDGHVYSTIDGIGGPAAMSFAATSGTARAVGGDVLPLAGPITLRVDVQAPAEARINLLKDGVVLASGIGMMLEHGVSAEAAAGVYRVEVSLPRAPGQPPVPWILSNPIYAGRDPGEAPPAGVRSRASRFATQYTGGPAAGWTVEHAPASVGALDVVPAATGGTQLLLRYALGGAASASPFTAFAMPAGPALSAHERLLFIARADRPMRLSVQLREPGGEAGQRWHRSVFLDTMPREITVYFDDMAPRGLTTSPRPTLANVQSVLFVVDTVNTALGSSGQIWIDDVRYAR